MEQNILILNAGTRNKVVRYFKENFRGKGRVIVTDSYRLAPAVYEGDAHYITKWCTQEGYAEEILDIIRKEKIKGIVSLLDPDLPVLARNKERFEREGAFCFVSDTNTIDLCFDKYKTYETLVKNGLRSAKTYNGMERFRQAYEAGEIGFPVFCKPVLGSGSAGIEKIDEMRRLEERMADQEGCLIQEYMKGQEIGADLYVDRFSGKLTAVFLKKKLKMRSGETDKSVSYRNPALFELLEELVRCVPITGPADVDLFEENGKYYVSEMNPRFGGGYPHAYECGVNFPLMMLRNMEGRTNEISIGRYEENIYMMKYFDVCIRKME